jgi:hypothetical protein
LDKNGTVEKKITVGVPVVSTSAELSTRSERSAIDAHAGIGVGATMELERALARTGTQAYTSSRFESHESVLYGGVLFALPSLISQGLDKLLNLFRPLPNGFYGLHHIILLLCFMALCRIKNPEQLKKYPCGELGKLLGLDRVPQVEYLRRKIHQITSQSKCDLAAETLFESWSTQMEETFYYIDGHVRVYNGSLAHLPKHYVSREKLCLCATSEFYVNTFTGMPLMVIIGQLNEKLKIAIEKAIVEIKKITPPQENKDSTQPLFTIVFDREAYEPQWFKKLWEEEHIAVISYRKNVKDKWDESLFKSTDVEINNIDVTMYLCEMGSLIGERWFREIRKLSDNGHQTAIITTHPSLKMAHVALKMFARWSQENFFKYMIANFDFDKMAEYGTEELTDKTIKIPNPVYKQLSYQIKKSREKKARLEAKIYQKINPENTPVIETLQKIITREETAIEQINAYMEDILKLVAERKTVPSRIPIEQLPAEKQYNMLKRESKKLKNIILMLAYRSESALYNLLPEYYANAHKDGRQLLKEIFTCDADFIPDYQKQTLTIRLHSLSTPRANGVAIKLCDILNQTESCFPCTNLKLIYDSVAF